MIFLSENCFKVNPTKKNDVFTDVEKLYFSVKRTSINFIYNFQKSSFIKDVAIVNDIL